jgi:sulfur relay protein TusB/DsrH
MLVIIRNAPDTQEGKRGVKIARDMTADIVLMQNGVYFLKEQALGDLGFIGTAYVLEEDRRLRGLTSADGNKKNIMDIDYDGLVDLMTETDKVVGMF